MAILTELTYQWLCYSCTHFCRTKPDMPDLKLCDLRKPLHKKECVDHNRKNNFLDAVEPEQAIKGKFIGFKRMPRSRKTERWEVITKQGLPLGLVRWEGSRLRNYAFFPNSENKYLGLGALLDIETFLAKMYVFPRNREGR